MAEIPVARCGRRARAGAWVPRTPRIQSRDALIDKAIKAQGGLDRLGRSVASHRKSKGAFLTDGFTFTGEVFSEPGNRRRISLQGKVKDRPAAPAGTRRQEGLDQLRRATFDLDAAFLERIEKSIYADRVCGLVTLVKDKGYALSRLGESQVKGKPALGVRVQSEGKPVVLLYFDKESGLLVKSSNRVTDPNLNREVNQEVYYLTIARSTRARGRADAAGREARHRRSRLAGLPAKSDPRGG